MISGKPSPLLRMNPVLVSIVLGATFFTISLGILAVNSLMERDSYLDLTEQHINSLALLAAKRVNVELHEKLLHSNQTGSELYNEALEPLVNFHNSVPSLYAVYTLRVLDDKMYVVLDTANSSQLITEHGELQAASVMDPLDYEMNDEPKLMPTLESGHVYLDRNIYFDGEKEFRTASAPIKNSQGALVAVMGLDYDMDYFRAQERSLLISFVVSAFVSLLVSMFIAYVVHSLYNRLQKTVNEWHSASITDPLTGLYNRRYFTEQINLEIARSERSGAPLALAFLDLDLFKKINDKYGHPVGDHILKEVSRRLSANIRAGNLVFRIGGEEFSVLIPAADLASAKRAIERLQEAMALPIEHSGHSIFVTLSAGITSLHEGEKNEDDAMLKRADDALYKAKNQGRNCIVVDE